MSTGIQTCEISLPGYTLTDRIGSGGYAEVWRAVAPGGIAKAVKIVYGFCDDEFASQELKALERIKGVRHPFLLSLERFEIVNGRLAIITELADMSLDQRLRQCRAEGLPGIPRDELLPYMADAAEALDFLSKRHNLLHLDIKPENLLILGDHVKVADFGLVKELATRTQNSLVSGMTPTYASPEVFDDDPSAFSDQYSLAIVYQEMLIGTLPFPGRTAAQLAKQHTQSEPQLASVPMADRSVLARALSKRPSDRFPSCKSFVDALRCVETRLPTASTTAFTETVPVVPQRVVPESDDTKPPSFCTTLRRSPQESPDQGDARVTRPRDQRRSPTVTPHVDPSAAPTPVDSGQVVDVAVPPMDAGLRDAQPTLYVAAGGVGIQLLCRLRALIGGRDSADDANHTIESIALDTDRDELRQACSNSWKLPLPSDDTLHLPLRLPSDYENAREILGWVSRRWLYNIPRSLETRGYRPLGRVALVDHSQKVLELIDQKLQKLAARAATSSGEGPSPDRTIKAFVLAGTGGGTGAGMVIDLANALKSAAAQRGLQIEVHGFFVCSCFTDSNASPLAAANTYSLLTELHHAALRGNVGTGGSIARTEFFESPSSPFNDVYWVPVRTRGKDSEPVDPLDALAKYLYLDRIPEARAIVRSCRLSPSPCEQTWANSFLVKTVGISSLTDHKRKALSPLAAMIAQQVKRRWLATDTTADWKALVLEGQTPSAPPTVLSSAGEKEMPPLPTAPYNDASPLLLRGRFNEYLSLEFTSEVLRQIQRQLETRDDRGRARILPSDAKWIADAARVVAASLVENAAQTLREDARSTASPLIDRIAVAASQRVVGRAIREFNVRQPERLLPTDSLDELIQNECQSLLEETLAQPDTAAEMESLIDTDKLAASAIDCATTNLLQCGCDRRTIILASHEMVHGMSVEALRKLRPLAAVVAADIDDAIVISEESAILPRSLASGLKRVFPDIDDAARRLHTRIDVDWQSPG